MPLLLTHNMADRLSSVIHTPLEINTLLGVVLMAHHLGVNAGQIEVGGLVFAAAGDDHFGFRWFAQQRLHDRLLLAAPDDGITARAEVIHQMRIAVPQRGNGGVFYVVTHPLLTRQC